jgi:hypothetical protein
VNLAEELLSESLKPQAIHRKVNSIVEIDLVHELDLSLDELVELFLILLPLSKDIR